MASLSKRITWAATAAYVLLLTLVSLVPSGADAGPLRGWDTDLSSATQNTAHVPAYLLLAGLVTLCVSTVRPVTVGVAAWVALGCCAYGATTEWAQSVIPGRYGSISDMLLNVVGSVVGAVAAWLVLRGPRKR